ncbi:MAG: ribokinase [Saprospiraceae bacterium]|nr:ribokinase [Saprospiraceae bacterium]
MKITVVGSSNTDMVVKVRRLPKPGETIIGHTFFTAAGGKGANQAVAAAKAGGEVSFIAKVGNDAFGEQAIQGFAKVGIDTRHVSIDPDRPSGVAQIMVDDAGENCIVVAPGANMSLLPADIDVCWETITNADIVLMQLESPIETISYLLSRAKETETKYILNPAPAMPLSKELLASLYLITPNETEAALLTGLEVETDQQVEAAGIKLLDQGVENVIITRGAHGATLVDQRGYHHIGSFSVAAVDTTAAGDVFNGALCVAIAAGERLPEACRFANAAAALSVTKDGAQPSAPSRPEILHLLQQQ